MWYYTNFGKSRCGLVVEDLQVLCTGNRRLFGLFCESVCTDMEYAEFYLNHLYQLMKWYRIIEYLWETSFICFNSWDELEKWVQLHLKIGFGLLSKPLLYEVSILRNRIPLMYSWELYFELNYRLRYLGGVNTLVRFLCLYSPWQGRLLLLLAFVISSSPLESGAELLTLGE